MAHWLHTHPRWGPVITNWHEHRAIDKKVKRRANCLIVLSFTFSIFIVPLFWQKCMLVIMLILLLFCFNRLREIEAVEDHSKNT